MPDDKILLFKKPQMYLPAYNLAPKSHIMNMVGKTRSQELEHNTLLRYIAATDYHFYVKLQLSQLFLGPRGPLVEPSILHPSTRNNFS